MLKLRQIIIHLLKFLKLILGISLGFAIALGAFIFIITMMILLNKDDLPTTFSAILSFLTAISTAWAAYAAAKSAKLSGDSLETTKKIASESIKISEKSLEATLTANRRTAFEQHFSLLLAQHNMYHEKVCDYIDDKSDTEEIKAIFEKRFNHGKLPESINFLTGHAVFSPYMRVLYHLLKHIDENFYSNDESVTQKKRYSSPLRSIIRNDVMYLIALNALNIKSDFAKKAGYETYQNLLMKFSFFEHAVFIDPQKPNESYQSTGLANKILELSKFNSDTPFEIIENNITINFFIDIVSPALACISIYENPSRNNVESVYERAKENIIKKAHQESIKIIEKYEQCEECIKNITNGVYGDSNETPEKNNYKKNSKEIMDSLRKERRKNIIFSSSIEDYKQRQGKESTEVYDALDKIEKNKTIYHLLKNKEKNNTPFKDLSKRIDNEIDQIREEIKTYQTH
ncbi:putative phage abortive infection protein [Dickeya dianthicola]|uniref:putative phage abortive infection protein n=1 Tax=Dickeya dianthicola TaxID=204039 RepID=UPI000422E054|nr:putative phage abortive infection protein [Dickeya dianthicola]